MVVTVSLSYFRNKKNLANSCRIKQVWFDINISNDPHLFKILNYWIILTLQVLNEYVMFMVLGLSQILVVNFVNPNQPLEGHKHHEFEKRTFNEITNWSYKNL